MEIRRKVKNVVYKYSEAEKYVREATSNDPWGPTSTLMSEIADMTQDYSEFVDIMQLIWKRMNDKGKNWRHVYKSLVLLDYLVKCGSDRVAEECLQNIHTIETLKDFQYFEDHKDLGIGIREKSKSLVILLKDKESLDHERSKGLKVKEKFQGSKSNLGSHQLRKPGQLGKEIRKQFSKETPFPKTVMKLNFEETRADIEEEELQRAIELSKEEHERSMKLKLEEERKEDLKIKLAMEQSKKEEEVLAVLRLPPKATDKQNPGTLLNKSNSDLLYKLSEASRLYELQNGNLDELDSNNKLDPWGSSTNKASESIIPLDFDPWKTQTSYSMTSSGTMNNSTADVWPNTTQSKNMIDDIFGDEKPNTQFASNWTFENNVILPTTAVDKDHHFGADTFQDLDDNDFTQLSKNTTGSFSSLTDIAKESSRDKIPHSCSEMNLLDSGPTGKKKTPQEFLGENAKLVNLENLLPIPKAGVYRNPITNAAKNPFGLTGSGINNSNPFNSQVANSKIPMNPLAMANQNNTFFGSSGHLSSTINTSQFSGYPPSFHQNFPISHSQYQGFSNMNNSNIQWPQTVAPIPQNQWSVNANNANPFFN